MRRKTRLALLSRWAGREVRRRVEWIKSDERTDVPDTVTEMVTDKGKYKDSVR